jgi:hypothetical protein
LFSTQIEREEKHQRLVRRRNWNILSSISRADGGKER